MTDLGDAFFLQILARVKEGYALAGVVPNEVVEDNALNRHILTTRPVDFPIPADCYVS